MLVFYDVGLYIVRSVIYEVPFIGGRVHGWQRPRAPSLTERTSGKPRTLSGVIKVGGSGAGSGARKGADTAVDSGVEMEVRQRRCSGRGSEDD